MIVPDLGLPENEEWECAHCGELLTFGKVVITYMGSEFTLQLPQCDRCGLVLIPEELALGKMAEVEKLLEDK